MKTVNIHRLLIAVVALSMIAVLSGCVRHSRASNRDGKTEGSDLAVKEEIKQTFKLAPATKVNISGINGSVDIQSSETDAADIHIVRSANDQSTLSDRKMIVEYQNDTLTIRHRRGDDDSLWNALKGRGEIRTRVMLKLPRNIRLDVSGVNGRVNTGEIDGSVEMSGINGKIVVAQTAGTVSLSGVNGPIDVGLKNLHPRGVEFSGINGPIELRFAGEVNADLDVSGFNGGFRDEGLNVQLSEKRNRHNFNGKIGNGGALLSFSGINGSLTLMKAGQTAGGSSAAPAK
jgi:hypothetical protein